MSEAPTLYDTTTDTGALDEGAGAALAAMYTRRGRAVYGLCRMMLRDPHEAEDALQSTFLSAHRALVSGTVPRDEAAWLATIARNECRGRIQERMRRPVSAEAAELEAVADPGRAPDELLADESVGKALAALPTSQREAVVLHDVFGLRSREVGAALGMSVPAVEAVIFRARRQLRMRLRPVGASALALPLGVQEALTLQIPGFAAGGAGAGTAALGAGVLAKVLATPTVVKLAAGAAAVVTTGSVVAVEKSRQPTRGVPPAAITVEAGSEPGVSGSPLTAGSGSAARRAASDDKGPSGRGPDEVADDRGGHGGSGSEGDGHGSRSGSSGSGGGDGANADGTGGRSGGSGSDDAAQGAASGGTADDGGATGTSGHAGDDSSPTSGTIGGSESPSGSGEDRSGTSGEEAEPTTEPTETEKSPETESSGSGTSKGETSETSTESSGSSSGSGSGGTESSGEGSSGHSGSDGPSGSGSGSAVDD